MRYDMNGVPSRVQVLIWKKQKLLKFAMRLVLIMVNTKVKHSLCVEQ